MKADRRVKILATLGPASSSVEVIEQLFYAGADVFRINMSHTPHAELNRLTQAIRDVERKAGRPIGVLADLQGPKLRVGEFAMNNIPLPGGAYFDFDMKAEPGNSERVYLPHPEIFASIEEGHTLLLDDGKLRMEVVEKKPEWFKVKVQVGGSLSSRKGVSLPDTVLPMSAMTAKDRLDLVAALGAGVDWIALSFVQRKEDLDEAHMLLRQHDGDVAVMSKIEKPSALTDLADIIQKSDGLMIARGDLGVELPVEKVPGIQKRILREARRAGKPVVVATQMLESMISSPVPTRAEVSDVATAVFEGADAVMLSAESAVGRYPVEAVRMMSRVAREVEMDPNYEKIMLPTTAEIEDNSANALSAAARSIASTMKLAAIICYTATGTTALRAARQRPLQPIIALTPVEKTARRLSIVWGLRCFLTDDPADIDDMVRIAEAVAISSGVAQKDQQIIISAGMPFGRPGATNMLRIAVVGGNGVIESGRA
ncbi:MAG: pyruvate kinase [Chitinophagales bacterium]|nr:pyruvate kinase [Hyphomicrobiales bacterium]